MEGECSVTFTGEHMFNPRRLVNGWDAQKATAVTEIYQCVCGARPKDEKAVVEQLHATADERRRQKELAKRLTGKNMDKLGTRPLPGFEGLV